MQITAKGKIAKQGFGFGTWAFTTTDGTTYELYEPPNELAKEIDSVTIEGVIREDVMTAANIGQVLEVHAFEL